MQSLKGATVCLRSVAFWSEQLELNSPQNALISRHIHNPEISHVCLKTTLLSTIQHGLRLSSRRRNKQGDRRRESFIKKHVRETELQTESDVVIYGKRAELQTKRVQSYRRRSEAGYRPRDRQNDMVRQTQKQRVKQGNIRKDRVED